MVKQATKGQREIFEENRKTILQYALATAIAIAINCFGMFLFDSTTTSLIGFGLTVAIQTGALLFMKSLSKARIDEKGHVVDAGADLNDPEAFGEYCKDSIILTVITQVLATWSTYAYLLCLAFPAAIGYKFVFSFLLPWVTAGSDEPDVDDKKLRKNERKREKVQFRR